MNTQEATERLMKFTLPNGDVVDFFALPKQSIYGIATRGFSHFSNEAGAKANGKVKEAIVAAGGASATKDVVTAQITAWREANQAQFDTWKEEAVADLCKATVVGTLGASTSKPGVSTTLRLRREAAKRLLIVLWSELTSKDGKKRALPAAKKGGLSKDEAAAKRNDLFDTLLDGLHVGGKFAKHARRFDRIYGEVQAEAGGNADAGEAEVSLDDIAA